MHEKHKVIDLNPREEELLLKIQCLIDNKIEKRVMHIDHSSTILELNTWLCLVPSCSYVAENQDTLTSHMLNRTDDKHINFNPPVFYMDLFIVLSKCTLILKRNYLH
mgnify:CR=1 FL=1